jgi:hypothetical protein
MHAHSLLLALLAGAGDLETSASPNLFRTHVEFLASDELRGRRSGTRGADVAARYLAAQFRRLGLEPAGEGGTYFQEIVVPLDAAVGTDSSVAYAPGEGDLAPLPGEVAPLSPSSGGTVEGELVYAGFGITDPASDRDDYAGLEVRGRVVLVERGSPGAAPDDPHAELPVGASITEKVANAKAHGAAGLLLCDPLEGSEEGSPPAFDPSASDGGIPALWISREAARLLQEVTGARVRLHADLERRTGSSKNVLGLIPGSRPEAGTIVVGAHYDHLGLGGAGSLARDEGPAIHNGADDNASGTAGLLEIARLLVGRRGDLQRSVLVAAFAGEELGLLGSARFVETPPDLPGPFAAMVNLDMIGRSREGAVEVIGTASSPRLAPLVERCAAGLDLQARISTGLGGFGGSDHLSFYHAGVPVAFFFTGAHEDYHRPSDDADRVRFEEGARIATLAARIAFSLAETTEAIPFVKLPAEQTTRGGGPVRSSLGTIPDYGSEPGGMRLAGVSEGGAAEKAGLRRGDILRRVGEVKIEGVQDLMLALRRYRAGEVVEVEFDRDGERRTASVEMGAPRGREFTPASPRRTRRRLASPPRRSGSR